MKMQLENNALLFDVKKLKSNCVRKKKNRTNVKDRIRTTTGNNVKASEHRVKQSMYRLQCCLECLRIEVLKRAAFF